MATQFFLGLDPGKSGGIALVNEIGQPMLVHNMPETERDVWDLIGGIRREYGKHYPIHCMVENVASSPQQGVVSAFTFGKGLGMLRMAVICSGIPMEAITPGKWQNELNCKTGGDKNISKSRAQELFPHLRVTHFNADALLIAEYCRRACLGLLRKADTPKKASKKKDESTPTDSPETPAKAAGTGRVHSIKRQPRRRSN